MLQKKSMTVPMGYDDLAQRMEYKYDTSGRIIGMDVEDTIATSATTLAANAGSGDETMFYYNTNQNRVKVINKSGDKFYYVYDPTASIPAVVYEQGPATGGRPGAGYRYVNIREPDGSLLRRDRYVEDQGTLALDQTRTYHFDGLGSTIELTDGSGVITDKFSYDAWGNVTRVSGSTNDNPYLYVGQLGYYTHYQEPTMNPLDQTSGTKLLQLGVRYYDPEIGRFISRDAVSTDDVAMYVYAANQPHRFRDPDGKDPIEGLTYPKFVPGKGCDKFDDASWQIAQAQKYVEYVVNKLNLKTCKKVQTVHCYRKDYCGKKPKRTQCGLAGWHSGWDHMHINWGVQCSSPYCIILHEMIHNCTNSTTGHTQHPKISIPGCGSEVDFGPVDPNEEYP